MNPTSNPVQPDGVMLERAFKDLETFYPELSVTGLMAFVGKLPAAGWALCGGGAVAGYTARRISPDLDILITEATAREARGLCPVDGRVSSLTGETWSIGRLDVDLVFSTEPPEMYALKHAVPVQCGNRLLRVVPLEWLIVAKIRLGRDKDLADARLLWPAARQSAHGLWRLVTFCRLYYPAELADLLASLDEIEHSLS